MYGAPLSKDLNLSIQQQQQQQQPVTGVRTPPQMSSPGLLRYRSAPSTMLGDVCGDFLPAAGAGDGHRQAGSPDHAADTVFARFLAAPTRPAAAAANHFPTDAATTMASQQQQQQQMLYQSQQQMAAMEGLFRTGGTDHAAAAGGNNNGLLRQSSSPAGFLNHLNMDNGWLREYAASGHGRRRRVPERRRRAAQGAAELLVAAGVGDVADLGDGQRGARRRQRRRRRGRQQQRRARLRHPRVPDGRLPRRRLGRALAVISAAVPRHHEAPPRRHRRQQERRGAAVQHPGQQQAVGGDGGHREVPPVPGRRAVQDPRQARVRHPPPQHRRAGAEDEDQRADTEAAGARPQHGKANEHVRHVGSGCRLHQGAPDAGQGDERRAGELHLLGQQADEALRQLTATDRPSRHGREHAWKKHLCTAQHLFHQFPFLVLGSLAISSTSKLLCLPVPVDVA